MTVPLSVPRLVLVVVGVLGSAIAPRAQPGWTPLWNGRDLSGWTTWIARPAPTSDVPGLKRDADGKYVEPIGSGRDPLKVFTVAANVDGRPAIRISGEAFGELRSTGSFSNYHLRFQFKWGERKWPPREKPTTARDSGLLYHVHAEPGAEGRTWARSIELQIQEHDVGDLYAVGSAIAVRAKSRRDTQPLLYDYDPAGEWTFFSQSQGAPGRCIKQPDNEKPTGEWNTIELIAFGDDAIHIVNGQVVMRLHGPTRIDGDLPTPVTSGPIILQSEGAEIFYRDIEVRPITAIPPEFVASTGR
jgi:3-keto-disaccharide hydrolase